MICNLGNGEVLSCIMMPYEKQLKQKNPGNEDIAHIQVRSFDSMKKWHLKAGSMEVDTVLVTIFTMEIYNCVGNFKDEKVLQKKNPIRLLYR